MNRCKFTLKVYLNSFAFFFICAVFPGTFIEAGVSNPADLNKRIAKILNNSSLKDISCGISIVSVKKNTSIYNYRGDDLFVVASNMKLLTTAAALDYLGPDYKYKTGIKTRGIITQSGILKGDIIIRGSGDPNLSGRFYDGNILAIPEYWANAIKNTGINKITGDIIADDSIFDRVYTNSKWPGNQLSDWYCAPSCGLSFNDNCVDITLVPHKKPGSVVMLLVNPPTSYFTIFNNCFYTQSKKEHAYSVSRQSGTNQIFIKGKFWINASAEKSWISVHNPALYLATVFKETLEKNGIAVYGDARLIREDDNFNSAFNEIAQTISTMEQTVMVTNKRSQNFYAEQILKTLGAKINGNGTLEAGIGVLHDFMDKLGFDPEEYQIDDGSGLSRGNRLSPKMITTLLSYVNKRPYGRVLYDSLPISGVDGGLQRRMASPQYKNKIHAKTGYIAGTSALSGYVDTLKGDVLAFSILMNNVKNTSTSRHIQDDICRTIADCYN